MALTDDGTCSISPVKTATARAIESSSTWPAGVAESCSPSASSVSVVTPRRMVASYALSVSARCPSRRVALPMPSTRTPVAIGSRVPAWPTRRVLASDLVRATTSCDVQPAGLSTTTRPSAAGLLSVTSLRLELVVFVLGRARHAVGVCLAGIGRTGGGAVHLGIVFGDLGEEVLDEGSILGHGIGK